MQAAQVKLALQSAVGCTWMKRLTREKLPKVPGAGAPAQLAGWKRDWPSSHTNAATGLLFAYTLAVVRCRSFIVAG